MSEKFNRQGACLPRIWGLTLLQASHPFRTRRVRNYIKI
jgi:hypothetical protein